MNFTPFRDIAGTSLEAAYINGLARQFGAREEETFRLNVRDSSSWFTDGNNLFEHLCSCDDKKLCTVRRRSKGNPQNQIRISRLDREFRTKPCTIRWPLDNNTLTKNPSLLYRMR